MFFIVRDLKSVAVRQVRRLVQRLTQSLLAFTFAAIALGGMPLQAQVPSHVSAVAVTVGATSRVTMDSMLLAEDTGRGSTTAATFGPRATPVALRVAGDSARNRDDAPLPQQNAGPDVALMGVGAAAVIVGLLIGGDGGTALAIGGGALGLVGLYRYLR